MGGNFGQLYRLITGHIPVDREGWGGWGQRGWLTKTKVKLWKNANSPLAQQKGWGVGWGVGAGDEATTKKQGVEVE